MFREPSLLPSLTTMTSKDSKASSAKRESRHRGKSASMLYVGMITERTLLITAYLKLFQLSEPYRNIYIQQGVLQKVHLSGHQQGLCISDKADCLAYR